MKNNTESTTKKFIWSKNRRNTIEDETRPQRNGGAGKSTRRQEVEMCSRSTVVLSFHLRDPETFWRFGLVPAWEEMESYGRHEGWNKRRWSSSSFQGPLEPTANSSESRPIKHPSLQDEWEPTAARTARLPRDHARIIRGKHKPPPLPPPLLLLLWYALLLWHLCLTCGT